MSAAKQFDEGRLMQVLVAPIVSEKATMAGEKHNQVLFKVLRDATKPDIDTIRARIAALLDIDVACVNVKGKTKEKLGYLGRAEAIETQAVCLLVPQ